MIRNRPTTNLRAGLVGAWSFAAQNMLTGGTGWIIPDLSGMGNHAVLNQMEMSDWITAGGYPAIDIKTDDYVDIPTFPHLTAWTISAWIIVPTNRTDYRSICTRLNTSAVPDNRNCYLDIEQTTGKIRTLFTQTAAQFKVLTSATVPETGTLAHLVGGYDGVGLMAIWINGRLDASTTAFTGAPDFPSGTQQIGCNIGADAGNRNRLESAVISVEIYNRLLQSPEVSELYRVRPGGWRATRRRSAGKRSGAAPPAQTNTAWWLAYQMGM